MEEQFAKLFIVDGEQFLVQKEYLDEEDVAVIQYTISHDGMQVSMTLKYKEANFEERDKDFGKIDQKQAEQTYRAMKGQITKMLNDTE